MPCMYNEYKIFENRQGWYRAFGVGFSLGTTEISIEEEQWVYPEMSFLAEFGGALGMFLGFSMDVPGSVEDMVRPTDTSTNRMTRWLTTATLAYTPCWFKPFLIRQSSNPVIRDLIW